jgi:hypothetical protein
MSVVPVIVLLSLVAVAVIEAVVFIAMKGDMPSTHRVQPE